MRRGRGFSYLDADGDRVSDEATLSRIRALGIPPAWRDVWICADPQGHLQATGIDAAGRKQYLYHEVWRQKRDRQKFADMEQFARALPRLRRQVTADLSTGELPRERVVACAVRMIDVAQFRIGTEEYASEEGGIGVATLERCHVRVGANVALFDYPAKGGVRRRVELHDPACLAVLTALRRRRGGSPHLLVFRDGRRWRELQSDDINEYIKSYAGETFSAKDFRTWNATVAAAAGLARRKAEGTTKTSRKRAMSAVVKEVAAILGNTPAVARRAYIDPRVFDRFPAWTIADTLDLAHVDETSEARRRRVERAVLDLLDERAQSGALDIDPELEPIAA